MKLYSYNPSVECKIRTLEESAIWLTFPKNFNDVFEIGIPTFMSPKVKPPFHGRKLIELASQCEHDPHVLMDDTWRESLLKLLIIDQQQPSDKKLSNGGLTILQSMYIQNMSENLGVMCFSSKSDSQLMWSYYADSHKGFCVEYEIDLDKLIEDNLFGREVDYVSTKPMLDIWQMFFSDYSQQYVFTKSVEWAHECEFRIAGNLRKMTSSGSLIGLPKENEKGFKILMPQSWKILKIVLGAKFDLSSDAYLKLHTISKVLSQKQGSEVKVVQAKIDAVKYKLNIS